MKRTIFIFAIISLALNIVSAQKKPQTFCNPLNISYRFSVENLPSHRTAADPVIVIYKDDYYLFASKSGGYWYSGDLRDWTFVEPQGLPLEDFAPSVLIFDGKMYYTAHRDKLLFTTTDPKKGLWTKTADIGEYADPMLFLDDDKRLYMYFGASLDGGITAVELDPKQGFKEISERVQLMKADSANHGWEGSGDDHLGYIRNGVNRVEPYIEGSWMTKRNGVYYLQYSAPGTIWKNYADGVYTSKSPTSNFVYQPYSPFSYKPGGFIGGAGHSSTFQDKQGNYWRVETMIVSVKHKFERRLGIFPAGFDADGWMRMNTYLGDYPQFFPDEKVKNPLENNLAGWNLLSFGKKAQSSSTLAETSIENAFDEDIKTVWSAKTSDKGEWLSVDLGEKAKINAVQINFGDQDTTAKGRNPNIYQQYILEISGDGKTWQTLIDKSKNTKDVPHDYVELEKPESARFVKITNYKTADGKFSIRDLRVFGETKVPKPAEVENFTVKRDTTDGRKAFLSWNRAANADNYIIRFGIAPDKLYNNFQVVKGNSLQYNALNKNTPYYFSIDSLGAGGVTKGGKIVKSE